MRKLTLLGSLVALAILASAGNALAATSTFNVKTDPSPLPTSTDLKKQEASINFSGALTPDAGALVPPYATGLEVDFGDAWGINKDAYKEVCTEASLTANGSCPSNTLIASGTATAYARPLIADPITTSVKVYNAAPSGDHVLQLLFYAKTTSPIETTVIIPGWVTVNGLPVITVDASGLPAPLGQKIYVSGMDVTTKNYYQTAKVAGETVQIPGVYAPKTCNGGKLVYTLKSTFSDAAPMSTPAESPCTQSKEVAKKAAGKKNGKKNGSKKGKSKKR